MTLVRWPGWWRRRASQPSPNAPAPAARPVCAMVALAEGTDQTSDLCAVPTCLGHGTCPVMSDLHELAGHLRRVRSQVQFERSQPSMTGRHVRLTAGRLAYSDLLQQACTMLHLPTDLASCSGVARDVEILRIEAALARYGITT